MLSTVYIALPILFGIFPWTKDMAQTLFGYVLDPLKDIGLGLVELPTQPNHCDRYYCSV